MILVFQIITDKELLNPSSMEQWPQFIDSLPPLSEGSISQLLRSQHRPSVLL
jgi:hypothetical protein